MANLYKVFRRAKQTIGGVPRAADESVVYVSATSEANAIAAAKSDHGKNADTTFSFDYQVQLERPNIVVGS